MNEAAIAKRVPRNERKYLEHNAVRLYAEGIPPQRYFKKLTVLARVCFLSGHLKTRRLAWRRVFVAAKKTHCTCRKMPIGFFCKCQRAFFHYFFCYFFSPFLPFFTTIFATLPHCPAAASGGGSPLPCVRTAAVGGGGYGLVKPFCWGLDTFAGLPLIWPFLAVFERLTAYFLVWRPQSGMR